jgi:membrane-associated protease RseP (regulator of RpoE activity)
MNLLLVNVVLSFFISLILHEFGHYIAARLVKIPVIEAGLGWGPTLCKFRLPNLFCKIRTLPIGAYIRLDMSVLRSRPLSQQLFVLVAGIAVNLLLAVLAWGSLFSTINLALAIGNLLPLYQHDGWKCGMVIFRRIFKGPSPVVEWSFTLCGGLLTLVLLVQAVLMFQN